MKNKCFGEVWYHLLSFKSENHCILKQVCERYIVPCQQGSATHDRAEWNIKYLRVGEA